MHFLDISDKLRTIQSIWFLFVSVATESAMFMRRMRLGETTSLRIIKALLCTTKKLVANGQKSALR